MKSFIVMVVLTMLLLIGCGHEQRQVTVWTQFANPLALTTSRPEAIDAVKFVSLRDVAVTYNIKLGQLFTEHDMHDKLCKYIHPSIWDMHRARLGNGYMLTGQSTCTGKVFFVHTKLDRNGRTCTRGFTVCTTNDLPVEVIKGLFTTVINMTDANADNVLNTLLAMHGEQREYINQANGVLYLMTVTPEYTAMSFLITGCPDAAE